MSGICGIVRSTRRVAQSGEVSAMLRSLRHRGPDGMRVRTDGPAGFGHAMLWATPESRREDLPLAGASGDCLLTADVRLDNREELLEKLIRPVHPRGFLTDADIILAAYEQWGTACAERLLGDFAFAIWDGRLNRLFCARDHFGVKPFYYFAENSGRFLAFASEIKALFAVSEIRAEPNLDRIREFLSVVGDDKESTSFQGVRRLGPGHFMCWEPGTSPHVHRYWQLDENLETRFARDDDYEEAFRDVFAAAVSSRTRADGPVGAHLSGGLDSSAIVAVCGRLATLRGFDLAMFSNVFPSTPACDEGPFIREMLARVDGEHFVVEADQFGPLSEIESAYTYEDEACLGANHFLVRGLAASARDAGIRVLLDGIDGDTVAWTGNRVFYQELLRANKSDVVAAELAAAMARRGKRNTPNHALAPLSRIVGDFADEAGLYGGISRVWSVSGHMEVSRARALHYFLRGRLKHAFDKYRESSQKRRPLFFRFEVPDQPDGLSTLRKEHYAGLTSAIVQLEFEQSDRTHAEYGIDIRHPFFDKRLVEFCYGLPDDQKIRNGYTRSLMRRALGGVLPQHIRARMGKANMELNFWNGLFLRNRGNLEVLLDHAARSDSFHHDLLDVDALRTEIGRIVAQKDMRRHVTNPVWRAISVIAWALQCQSLSVEDRFSRERHMQFAIPQPDHGGYHEKTV
jgi:asparagine synthase (glutamine-hydrolysing)